MIIKYKKTVEVCQELTALDIDSIMIKSIQYKKQFISENGEIKTDMYYLAHLSSPCSLKYDAKNQKIELGEDLNKLLLDNKSSIRVIANAEQLIIEKFKIYCIEKFYPNKFYPKQIRDLVDQYGFLSKDAEIVINSIQEWSDAIHYYKKPNSDKFNQYVGDEFYEWKQDFIKSDRKY